jgi:uroporphyrin-III C-methyltransferase
MSFEVDLRGRIVLIVGGVRASRRAVADATAHGARVTLLSADDALAALEAGIASDEAPPFDLVVWVDGPADTRSSLFDLARRRRVLCAVSEPVRSASRGHVALVGGGPGDPELLTVAGRRALAMADVVLHDRLGPREGLHELAPGAELIDVGKTPGHHAVPQDEIERIMIEKALSGLKVVRLKGGDPFVFGRGGEEVIACHRVGVPVQIVPGVTSAIAVPAEAGIPVTHRDISRAFTVISGHVPLTEDELAHAVGFGGTLVILMGVNTLPHLSAGLRRHGMRADVPVALLERGFSNSRRSTVTTLERVLVEATLAKVQSPAVIVIGDVVNAITGAEQTAALAGLA